MRWTAMALWACLVVSPNLMAADDARALAAQAKALVEARDPGKAFDLLAPHEERLGGDVEFDYWFGVAALESSKLDRAVIAFERVLVKDPLFDSARLELARTYLRMGAVDLAAQEFERLLARAPNPQGRKLIEDYLAEIARIKERRRFALSGYVEIGGGRDTNISSSTNDFPSAILSSFGLPGIVATGNSIKRADNFVAAAAGGDAIWRFNDERMAFASASVRWRGYREFDDYDYLLGDFIGGYRLRAGGIDYTASAILQTFKQDGAPVDTLGADRIKNDRDAVGANLEVRRELNPTTQIALGAQYTAYRYPSNPGQDTRQTVMSIALEKRLPAWAHNSMVGLRAFYGQDEARRPLNPFTDATASRHTYGVRFVAQSDPGERWSWQHALAWSRRIDDDQFARATLVPTGRDDLFEAFVRLSYRITPALSVSPYASYIYNRSNIELYTFHKAEGGLMLRYEVR